MLKRITNNKRKIVPNLIPKSKLVMRGNHCKQSEPKPLFPQLMRKKIEFSISLTAYFEKWFFSFAWLQAKWSENYFLHPSPLHQNEFLWSDIKTFCHNHKTFSFERTSSTTQNPSNDSGNDQIRHISTSGKSKVKTFVGKLIHSCAQNVHF